MKKTLKDLLLECELLLKERKFDELINKCQAIKEIDFKSENMSVEEAKECLRIINHLIETAEKERTEMANTVVNINRFKSYLK